MTRTSTTHNATVDDYGETLPRYFAKAGHSDQNPNEIKRGGAGKGNWGRQDGADEVDELDADGEFHFFHQRKRTNSQSGAVRPDNLTNLHGPNSSSQSTSSVFEDILPE
ncbi:hypothetical protein NADFUDRAFT_46880 [Nadsonia fulvescens var. elongata DSM 6958]|uniref:Hyaluronan/mRNA-binding protein domain-containing protein n=1 Tax=Nadsonia fulvescens var. elongata DSM 6958 TaxID=857566 RepID=A0A1E3PIL2_9ASCO|nr:hypothetical protein NADFUDRAFT_46880 [Nadsonia fulvescens var. elongata DSM 6958]